MIAMASWIPGSRSPGQVQEEIAHQRRERATHAQHDEQTLRRGQHRLDARQVHPREGEHDEDEDRDGDGRPHRGGELRQREAEEDRDRIGHGGMPPEPLEQKARPIKHEMPSDSPAALLFALKSSVVT